MHIKSFSSTSLLSSIVLYSFYKRFKRGIYVASLLIVVSITSCYQHYYRTNTKASVDTDLLKRLQAVNKYFILHLPDRNSGLQNVTINQNNIEGDEVALSGWHTSELTPSPNRPNVVLKSKRDSVLTQVHLYTSNKNVGKGRVSIPVTDINRIDVYEYDQQATRFNHTLSSAAVGIATAVAVFGIVMAIACNCPQVYVEDNGNAHFNGGLYSGAIYSTLERTDYMPLPPIRSDNTDLKISVKNALEEEQFINSVQLLRVEHRAEEKVLADRHGQIHSYQHPQEPSTLNSSDYDVLNRTDGKVYSFSNTGSQHSSELVLRFKSENQKGKAKLIIHGKNSAWSGFVFKEFSSLFGESAEAWRRKQEKTDPEILSRWQRDQSLPLLVSVKEGNTWKYVDYFPLTGNTASRDMIIAFDYTKGEQDFIEVKLETVYRFWDLDYVGLDLTNGSGLTSKLIEAKLATNKAGVDQRIAIAGDDKNYSHLTNDDAIDLQFDLAPSTSDMRFSYFLVSKGYYHNLAKYPGKAQTMELLNFKNKGGFNTFSRKKYQDINEVLAKYQVKETVSR